MAHFNSSWSDTSNDLKRAPFKGAVLNLHWYKMAHFNSLASDTSIDLKRAPRRGAVLNLRWFKYFSHNHRFSNNFLNSMCLFTFFTG